MSKKTLNQANLETLGAAQLAALLIEVSEGSADIKRRLRLELSHNLGTTELAHDVRKRLVALRKANSFVGWRKRKALIKDLDTQASMIVEKIAPQDAATAFDLLWEFIDIAPSIFARVDDSKGDVGEVFRTAIGQFAMIAPRAQLDPLALADRVWTALTNNGQGEWDGIIALMAPTLGPEGLSRLRLRAETYAEATEPDDGAAHDALRFLHQLRGGNTYASERKARFVKWCLQEIATAAGDIDAYIAQYSDEDLARQDIAAKVALLLLDTGKAARALDLLQNAVQGRRGAAQEAWDAAYIAALSALGRVGDAQAHRWTCFITALNTTHLRDHLKHLPDFEDIEAEDRARLHVSGFPNLSTALTFCLEWPDLVTAARLIETRTAELNGANQPLLAPLAEALRPRHPRAAMVLWRTMIDHTLEKGLTPRYAHAADHLADCTAVDAEIIDYGPFLPHSRYLLALKNRHDRKSSFWARLP